MAILTLATLLLPYASNAQQQTAVKEAAAIYKVEKLTSHAVWESLSIQLKA